MARTCYSLRNGLYLEMFAKGPQVSVEHCRIIPEGRVPHVGHDLDLSVRQTGLVHRGEHLLNRILRGRRIGEQHEGVPIE